MAMEPGFGPPALVVQQCGEHPRPRAAGNALIVGEEDARGRNQHDGMSHVVRGHGMAGESRQMPPQLAGHAGQHGLSVSAAVPAVEDGPLAGDRLARPAGLEVAGLRASERVDLRRIRDRRDEQPPVPGVMGGRAGKERRGRLAHRRGVHGLEVRRRTMRRGRVSRRGRLHSGQMSPGSMGGKAPHSAACSGSSRGVRVDRPERK